MSQIVANKAFGGLQYKFGRSLDGIQRYEGAAIMESSYRLIYGVQDVYITCIYRWLGWPVICYIIEKSVEFGKRMGKNTLLIPIKGCEEQYWADAREIIQTVSKKIGQNVELDDGRVYILISGCHPQNLVECKYPFLLCDISELSVAELTGFFSKLLDIFDVQVENNWKMKKTDKQPTVGNILFGRRFLKEEEKALIESALLILAETVLIMDSIHFQFIGFDWAIKDSISAKLEIIRKTPELYTKLMRVKNTFCKLKKHTDLNSLNRPYLNLSMPVEKDEKIKVLFLTSNPSSTTRIRFDKEIREIQESIRKSELRHKFDIIQYSAVRPKDIQAYLLQHEPDIVHFIGHGSPKNKIILEDDAKDINPVPIRALSELFRILKKNIRCVILNACYTEPQAKAISDHIECVIGMSRKITDNAAISFSKAFYQALAYGKDVKTAFELGRNLIDLKKLGEKDKPKLLALKCNPEDIVFVHNE